MFWTSDFPLVRVAKKLGVFLSKTLKSGSLFLGQKLQVQNCWSKTCIFSKDLTSFGPALFPLCVWRKKLFFLIFFIRGGRGRVGAGGGRAFLLAQRH